MAQDWYIVAKMFNQRGSLCYRCKTDQEMLSLPDYLELIRQKGMQIVLLNNPDIYSEYAPYTYVDNLDHFIGSVSGNVSESLS